MRLPEWIPEVTQPMSSPETWSQMSPNERKWSFVIDFVIGATCIIALYWLDS